MEKCGHPEPSKDSKSSSPSTISKLDKPIQVTTSAHSVDSKGRIHGNIDTFMRSLLASKEFYANLADTMCSADKFATGFDQEQCWTGHGLGRYVQCHSKCFFAFRLAHIQCFRTFTRKIIITARNEVGSRLYLHRRL